MSIHGYSGSVRYQPIYSKAGWKESLDSIVTDEGEVACAGHLVVISREGEVRRLMSECLLLHYRHHR